MADKKWAIDEFDEYITYSLIILIVGGLFGGLYLWENPNLEDRVYALTNDRPEFSGEEIVFQESYDDVATVESLNKIYSDTDTEYGWCMRVEDNRVERLDAFKQLNETTPGNIRFSCSSEVHNAIMHTHPDGDNYRGITALSERDENTLKESSWVEVSCVVGGEISNSSSGYEGIGCWNIVNDEIQELDVSFS